MPPARTRLSPAREYLEAVLVAVVFALFVRTFLLQAYVVPTPSMEPQILVGDHLIVNKFLYARRGDASRANWLPQRDLRRGDVFVFKFPEDPGRDFVKRAVALAGDVVEIQDKVILVNGVPQREAHAAHADRLVLGGATTSDGEREKDQFGPRRVPAGHVFALGDNRDSSNDSRFWGPVPTSYVKGRALFVYWSLAAEEPGRSLLRRFGDLFTRTRWERTFRPVR